MNYTEIYQAEKIQNRKEMIDEIYSIFDIGSDDIQEAASSAEIGYPNEVAGYYFLATCIQSGRSLLDMLEEEDSVDFDSIRDFAIDCVPSSTYATWRLWLEFGRETDAYDNLMGSGIQLSQMESVASLQLSEYASRIIYSMAD